MKRRKTIILAVLLVLGLSLRAQTEPVSVTTADEKANAFYLEGLRQQHLGNYSEAFDLYRHALALKPDLVGALYELSDYGRYLRDDSMAVDMLERAAAIDSCNYWLKQSLVKLYVSQQREDDAIALLEQMAKQYPTKSEVTVMLVDMYTRRQDYANTVKALDRLELLEGKSQQLSMEKFRNYMYMKDEQHAFAEMKSLAEQYPYDVRYRVLLGDVYLDGGKYDEALSIYREIEKEHPDNINLQLSLISYYQLTSQDSLAEDALERLVLNPKLEDDTRVGLVGNIVARNIQLEGDTAQIMPLLHKVLSYPQKDTRMAELCARYLIQRDAPKTAVKPVLEQMLSIDPEMELARNQLLAYAVQEEDTVDIIRLCRTAVDYHSPDPIYYYYLGLAYFQQRKNRDALQAFQQGLTKVNDKSNLTLITNMYAISGDLYHHLGDDDKAFQAYDSCLIYRPDDALVLNNYAYYMSLKKRDLKRAEEMSLRSLEQEGKNPTYLDTYAWILFQQRRYEEARVAIDSVLVLLGDSVSADDANLVEHAGDIYSRCGQKERAVELWQQALRLSHEAEEGTLEPGVIARIEEKIRKKKYVEK